MVKLKILRLNLGLPALIDQRHQNFTSLYYTNFLKLTRNVYNTEAQVLLACSRRSDREVDGANKYEHEKQPGGW